MERFKKHVEYSERRDHWAKRALALLEKGDDKAGRAAAAKAEHWDRKVKKLEP